MEEPPTKRVRRADAASMWSANDTPSPKSPPLSKSTRASKHDRTGEDSRNGDHKPRRDEERRKRSISRDKKERRRDRSRSRERTARDHGKDRDQERENLRASRESRRQNDRTDYDRKRRKRSRDHDRPRSSTDHTSMSDRVAHRSRSRSPVRNGTGTSTRTRSPVKSSKSEREAYKPPHRDKDRQAEKKDAAESDTMQIDAKAGTNGALDDDDEDALLQRMMGFGGFKSTKDTKVPGNQIYGVQKEKKTEYRQYMNRVGGFNRPLSPSR